MKNGNISHLCGLRVEAKMTQKKLAKLLDCTEKTYRSWELREALPNPRALNILASTFNTTTDYILERSDVKSRDMNVRALHDDLGLSEKAAEELCQCCENSDYRNGLNMLLEHHTELQYILSSLNLCKNYSGMTNLEREYKRQGITAENMTVDQKNAVNSDRIKYRDSLLASAPLQLGIIMQSLIDSAAQECN